MRLQQSNAANSCVFPDMLQKHFCQYSASPPIKLFLIYDVK